MAVISAVSLFSGCGGSDYGLRQLGVDVIWANDIWRPACDVYRLNMPEAEVVCADIRSVVAIPEADLLIGCYPCQGFSQGGRRDPGAEINQLYVEFGRALTASYPKAFIVENVVGMTFGRNKLLLKDQVDLFSSLGYTVKWRLFDARDYGMAQERKRVFLVGVRNDVGFDYEFPSPTHGPSVGKPYVPQRDVLQGFPEWPEDGYSTDPLTWYYMSRRRRHDWDETSACVVGHYRSIPLHPVSPRMEYVGKDEYRFMDDGPARRYTYLECAALQGFSPSFNWGSESVKTKYRMIGNAVPPPLLKAVAKPLVRLLGECDLSDMIPNSGKPGDHPLWYFRSELGESKAVKQQYISA